MSARMAASGRFNGSFWFQRAVPSGNFDSHEESLLTDRIACRGRFCMYGTGRDRKGADRRGPAYGDLWTTRFAGGDMEFIGCGVDSIDLGVNGTFVFAFCQARDIDENLAFCFTENDSLSAPYG